MLMWFKCAIRSREERTTKTLLAGTQLFTTKLPIFRTDKSYFIRVWEKCCGMVIFSKNITVTEK